MTFSLKGGLHLPFPTLGHHLSLSSCGIKDGDKFLVKAKIRGGKRSVLDNRRRRDFIVLAHCEHQDGHDCALFARTKVAGEVSIARRGS